MSRFLGQNHLFHSKLFSPLERSCFTVAESGRNAACGDYHDLQSFEFIIDEIMMKIKNIFYLCLPLYDYPGKR